MTLRWRASLLIATVLVLPVAPARAAEVSVSVEDFHFAPAHVEPAIDDAITWTWNGVYRHRLEGYRNAPFTFDGTQGDRYTIRYTGGELLYRCTYHSSLDTSGRCTGMCGSIGVRDVTPPEPPVITSPTARDRLDDSFVTFTGTASDDTTALKLYEFGPLATASPPTGGTWTAAAHLVNGTHRVTVLAFDRWENSSASTVTFTVDDHTAPAVPAITEPTRASSQRYMRLRGQASEDTARVGIYEDGTLVRTVTPYGSAWTAAVDAGRDGPHEFWVTGADGAGNVSAESAHRTVYVDTAAPQGAVTRPRTTTLLLSNQVVATGVAVDDFRVAVIDVIARQVSTNSRAYASPTCDGCGTQRAEWSAVLALSPGAWTLTVRLYDDAGNETTIESDPFLVL